MSFVLYPLISVNNYQTIHLYYMPECVLTMWWALIWLLAWIRCLSCFKVANVYWEAAAKALMGMRWVNRDEWDKCFGRTGRTGPLAGKYCHRASFCNHMSASVGKFLDSIRDTGDLQHHCMGCGPRLNKKEDGIWAWYLSPSAPWLWMSCDHLPHSLSLLSWFPYHDGKYLKC